MPNSLLRFALSLFFTCVIFTPMGNAQTPPVKIGVLLPLTGDFAFFGEQARQGVELAVSELNAKEKGVEVIFEDDRCLPKEALSGFKKLTSVNKVNYILGPACTGSIVSVAKAAQPMKQYMLALLDTNRPVAESGPYTYAMGYSSEEEAAIVADYMRTQNLGKTAVIYEDDAWAVNVKDAFIKRFHEKGGTILAEESQVITNASSAPDYRSVLSKVMSKKPDSLYVVPAYNGGFFLKQLRSIGNTTPVFGPDTFAVPEVIEIAREHANGVVCANALVNENSPPALKLREGLKKTYGKVPTSIFYSALGYDGIHVLVAAARSGKDFPTAMKSIEYTSGVIPVKGFDEDRLLKLTPGLFTIENQTFIPLKLDVNKVQ